MIHSGTFTMITNNEELSDSPTDHSPSREDTLKHPTVQGDATPVVLLWLNFGLCGLLLQCGSASV